jgi:26S proteasome regulatory subunit N8
MRLGDISG